MMPPQWEWDIRNVLLADPPAIENPRKNPWRAQLARIARESSLSANAGTACSARNMPSREDTRSSGGNSCQPYPR